MKIKFTFLLLIFSLCKIYAQTFPDSLLPEYFAAKTSRQKQIVLNKCFARYVEDDSSFVKKVFGLKSFLIKQNDVQGVAWMNLAMVNHANWTYKRTTALSLGLPLLADCKQRGDTTMMRILFQVIAFNYEETNNELLAAKYWTELIPIWQADGNKKQVALTNNYVASNYAAIFKVDSGLLYAQHAVKLANELNDDTIRAYALSTLAENYIANKDYDLAMPFLRRSLVYALKTGLDSGGVSYIYNDFAQCYLGTDQTDSAYYYLKKSLSLSNGVGFKTQQLRSYKYLCNYFEKIGKQDSLNKYFRLAVTIKDSIASDEKIKEIAAINFQDEIRQEEIRQGKIKEMEDRKINLQYVLLAFGIVSFFILFLLLSRSFITNERLIRFLGVLALLIVFEFLNLLLHPFLEEITGNSPFLMLGALVTIAALLIPLHHKLEKWTTAKLVEKNKTIRLAHAKKTIEKLEEK